MPSPKGSEHRKGAESSHSRGCSFSLLPSLLLDLQTAPKLYCGHHQLSSLCAAWNNGKRFSGRIVIIQYPYTPVHTDLGRSTQTCPMED